MLDRDRLAAWLAAHPETAARLAPKWTRYIPHQPTVRQGAFLVLDQREAMFGGAAGGGKSDALLMAALQYVDVPRYAAILFRRTLADLSLPGALLERSHDWLTRTDARWNSRDHAWTFPAGSTLSFGYLDQPRHKYRYQSSEFQFIGFDELTQFAEPEYRYLFSRLRRPADLRVPLRMRAASNPGGVGHAWVRQRFLIDGRRHGRVFIPARLADNPHLDGDSYRASLDALDATTRSQLLDGDWDAHDDTLVSHADLLACAADCLWPGDAPPAGRPELYLGVDVGRTRDLTVIWTWERVGDVAWCRQVAALAGASFAEQREAIARRLTRYVVRCAIDRGGIGMQLAEELQRAFPAVIEPVTLGAGVQGRLAQRLAVAIAARSVRLPDDPVIRDDFRQVRKTRVVGGVTQVASERSAAGHADRFWAAALGYDALGAHAPVARAALPRAFART